MHDRLTTLKGLTSLKVAAGLAASVVLVAGAAQAQTGRSGTLSSGVAAQEAAVASMNERFPQRVNALRLMRRVQAEFRDQRLEDVINFIREFTGADIEVMWQDDRSDTGLDPEQLITLNTRNRSALEVLEAVLVRATDEFTNQGNQWQFTPDGVLQLGPKSRLNAEKRLEIYPIMDLVLEIPDYTNAPEFDLNTILQGAGGGGGGGGGQSPFQEQEEDDVDRRTLQERVDELVDILTETVEPEQWEQNAGDGGSIRYWQGHLIINAPDYMHRQIAGYPWWPQRLTRVTRVNGQRYVGLAIDAPFATLNGLSPQEVSAVVNGRIIRSGPGGGG